MAPNRACLNCVALKTNPFPNLLAAQPQARVTPHFDIASVLARAAGECCPSSGHLEELHRTMNTGFGVVGDHLAEELVEGAEKQLAEEAKDSK